MQTFVEDLIISAIFLGLFALCLIPAVYIAKNAERIDAFFYRLLYRKHIERERRRRSVA